ncbi:MAG: carbohydrate-binding protein [Leptolyngbya sp. SIO3F4]|nr:carbohydrate-binding protein [Leptolyngbya sp. SIO3F4]
MNAAETFTRIDQLASREALKRTFQNRIRLSESHFALLIHSTLNKRDDQFHGYWREGHTYQSGDVVYYDGALWEMTAEEAICGKEGEEPGVREDWKSSLKDLEVRVDCLQQDLEKLCREFQEYKEQMEYRWQRVDFQLTILTVTLSTICVGWLGSYFYHLWVGAG